MFSLASPPIFLIATFIPKCDKCITESACVIIMATPPQSNATPHRTGSELARQQNKIESKRSLRSDSRLLCNRSRQLRAESKSLCRDNAVLAKRINTAVWHYYELIARL